MLRPGGMDWLITRPFPEKETFNPVCSSKYMASRAPIPITSGAVFGSIDSPFRRTL